MVKLFEKKMSRFKEERERRGFQQSELAELIDVTRRTISRWENEETPIPSDKLNACFQLGFDVFYIVTGLKGQQLQTRERPALSDRERLALAIEVVTEGLEQADRYLPPHKFSELVLAAYDLMADPVQTRDNIIQLVRRVA